MNTERCNVLIKGTLSSGSSAVKYFLREFVVFDQPLLPCSDIKIWTKMFHPFKLICVFRDIKDQLAEMINRGVLFSAFNSPVITYTGVNILSVYGKDRKGMIRFLSQALKKRMDDYDYLERYLNPEQILIIDFEGLVNKYELYKSKIEGFPGNLSNKHKFKSKYFTPDISRNNIGIYKKFLYPEDLEEMSELQEWYSNRCKTMIFQ